MMSNQFAVKPRGRAFRSQTNTEPVFGDQYTVECEVIANPLPICEWRRQTFPSIITIVVISHMVILFFSTGFLPLSISPDVVFTNNNCTIAFAPWVSSIS